jgi:hypothetical protein
MGRDDDDTADRCVCTLPASLVLALWLMFIALHLLRLFCNSFRFVSHSNAKRWVWKDL